MSYYLQAGDQIYAKQDGDATFSLVTDYALATKYETRGAAFEAAVDASFLLGWMFRVEEGT